MYNSCMKKDILPPRPDPGAQMAMAGLAANQAAAASRFEDYRLRRAAQTLRRQDADLALFSRYLNEIGAISRAGDEAGSESGARLIDFSHDPTAWRGVTWGLVESFARWLLLQGYTVSSVNVRLSTVKTYSRLAVQAGNLPPEEHALIRLVQGYSQREARRVDERRVAADVPLRVGLKKSAPVNITLEVAVRLKTQPDTPQGRRDALLLCLLLDHGLRAGEAALLRVEDFDVTAGVFRFRRPKVDKLQTHRLTPDTLAAARRYLQVDALPSGKLLRASRKDGSLRQAGLSTRAISGRVAFLGETIGLPGLSAHDCRHHWATRAARAGTPLERLQDAGGWNSLAMPARYIEAAEIANDGVDLDG